VYRFRPFCNTDPPSLADIWQSQPTHRRLLQPVTPQLLEYGIFSKIQFDRHGLIVATRDNRPIGFVHAGFGPNELGTAIDQSLGTTYMLMLHGNITSTSDRLSLADELLGQSERYLREKGAKVLYAGGIHPLDSFYLGLYGGSEIPGVLHTDSTMIEACTRGDYREISRVAIMQCDLSRYHPPFSRGVRQIKRSVQLIETHDLPSSNWWDACTWSGLQRDCFELVDKAFSKVVARTSFWDVQPLSASWGMVAAGMFDLFVDPEWRRRGCASHLIAEAFRLLKRRGVTTVEAQLMHSNEAARAFYRKLGFTEVDYGLVFRKEGAADHSSTVQ
jgi:ribosomal protein S18 acetylase RimI-like enzyme